MNSTNALLASTQAVAPESNSIRKIPPRRVDDRSVRDQGFPLVSHLFRQHEQSFVSLTTESQLADTPSGHSHQAEGDLVGQEAAAPGEDGVSGLDGDQAVEVVQRQRLLRDSGA